MITQPSASSKISDDVEFWHSIHAKNKTQIKVAAADKSATMNLNVFFLFSSLVPMIMPPTIILLKALYHIPPLRSNKYDNF